MSGVLAIWSELGPLGLLLYFGFHLYALFRIAKAVRGKAYSDPTQRILAEAFPPVMAMIILLNIITDYLYLAFFTGGLWIWAACVWTPSPAWKSPAAKSGESPDSKKSICEKAGRDALPHVQRRFIQPVR